MRVRAALLVCILSVVVLLASGCAPNPVQRVTFGDATLGLEGASVRLTVTVTCQRGWNLAFGFVHVAQNNDGRLAQGFGSFSNEFPGVPCTGSAQTMSILVRNSSPWAFRRDDAAADAEIDVFNQTTGSLVTKVVDPVEILIRSPA